MKKVFDSGGAIINQSIILRHATRKKRYQQQIKPTTTIKSKCLFTLFFASLFSFSRFPLLPGRSRSFQANRNHRQPCQESMTTTLNSLISNFSTLFSPPHPMSNDYFNTARLHYRITYIVNLLLRNNHVSTRPPNPSNRLIVGILNKTTTPRSCTRFG